MNPDWVTAIATIGAVLVALYGVIVARDQLKGLRETLRTNSLMAVLAIESDLGERKERCDELIKLIAYAEVSSSPNQKEIDALRKALDAAVENWLNALERLCFCISKNYVPEKDWRAEYRDYVTEVIRSNPKLYQIGTRYKHTVAVHERWAKE